MLCGGRRHSVTQDEAHRAGTGPVTSAPGDSTPCVYLRSHSTAFGLLGQESLWARPAPSPVPQRHHSVQCPSSHLLPLLPPSSC